MSTLGGPSLYGDQDHLGIALRELIQNARDAVAARRALTLDYVGKIRVLLKRPPLGGTYIEVEDDGVGMSERVLTGPFLDFGTSFWISSLVQEEFPGLRSSHFRPVGRFGIGFYSVFMTSSEVTVSTRPWDAGSEDVRRLTFPKGLTLRPVLSKGRPEDFSAYMTTKVSCRLKDDAFDLTRLQIRAGPAPDLHVAFADYVAALVAGLDVKVECRNFEDMNIKVHQPIADLVTTASRRGWLENLSFAKHLENRGAQSTINKYADRLRFLQNGEHIYGLAALSIESDQSADFLSVQTVGGLATSLHNRNSFRYVGYFDHEAKSARREPAANVRAPPEILTAWAAEQIRILEAANPTLPELCFATCSLCDLGLDPLPIAYAFIVSGYQTEALRIHDIFNLVKGRGLAVFKSPYINHADAYNKMFQFKNYPTFRPVRPSAFLSLELADGKPKNEFSFIGCLHRCAKEQAIALRFELRENAGKNPMEPRLPLQVLLITVNN